MWVPLLVIVLAAAPPAEKCVEASLPPLEHVAQTGPGCLVAAVTMALQAAGDTSASYRDVSMATVVHVDGASFFEALLTVEERGFDALAVQGGPELIALALRAGLAPVAAVSGPLGRHAVYVEAAGCGTVSVRDPSTPGVRKLKNAAFSRWQSARQLLLVFRGGPDGLERLFRMQNAAGLLEQHSRFRGEGWARKAKAEPEGSKGRCRFFALAALADPASWGVSSDRCRVAP